MIQQCVSLLITMYEQKIVRNLVDLADISFLDLIDTEGDKAIDALPKKIKQNERSVAEILAANMRKMIISERSEQSGLL